MYLLFGLIGLCVRRHVRPLPVLAVSSNFETKKSNSKVSWTKRVNPKGFWGSPSQTIVFVREDSLLSFKLEVSTDDAADRKPVDLSPSQKTL